MRGSGKAFSQRKERGEHREREMGMKTAGGGKMMPDWAPETSLAGGHLHCDPRGRQGEVQAMTGLRYMAVVCGHSLFLKFGVRVRGLLHGVE